MYTVTLAFVADETYPEGKVGWLCVRHADCYGDKPELTILYWPSAHGREHDFREIFPELGNQAQQLHGSDGAYSFYRGFGVHSPVIRLKDGGKTLPIKTEKIPIPCPKVRKGIETRFRNAQWQKYLKSQGWVAV